MAKLCLAALGLLLLAACADNSYKAMDASPSGTVRMVEPMPMPAYKGVSPLM